jgi:hypothetical protein
MARAQTAYLKREDVPARKALQDAIDRLGELAPVVWTGPRGF